MDFLQSREDRSPLGSIAEALLSSISEIIKSVIYIQVEKEMFTEIGCYFYRASAIFMELRINWSTPTITTEILQSLSKKLELAKSFTAKLEKNTQSIKYHEFSSMVKQLEDVVRGIGENLSLIPSATYGNHEYAEWAAKALSKEMRDVSFSLSSDSNEPQLHDRKFPTKEMMREEKEKKLVETDLYSIDADASAMNIHFSTLSETSQSYVSASKEISMNLEKSGSKTLSATSSSSMAFPQLNHYMEPLYDTFFCPLTKKVMEDPVTVESGVTYERSAITQWFEKFADEAELVCPKSGQTLKSRNVNSNVAFKATIDEWKERNEAARIKVARAALALASTEDMVLQAIDDLRSICKSKPYNKVQVRSIGMIPFLAKFLEYRSRSIRYAALDLLRQLAEDDEEGKVIYFLQIFIFFKKKIILQIRDVLFYNMKFVQDEIMKTVDISTIVKMLSSNHIPVRNAAASLLFELSKSNSSIYKIGAVAGGILMLITVKYKQSSDTFASETADKILKNLEILPENIKHMAENGYWEPLLAQLIQGKIKNSPFSSCGSLKYK